MKAYVIAAETTRDEAVFATYRKEVPATIAAFGGKFVVRGDNSRPSKANGHIRAW
jgi:uncharacterized protein (DUF1330 family)